MKHYDDPSYILSMLCLQSDRYGADAEFKEATDNVLNAFKRAGIHLTNTPQEAEAQKRMFGETIEEMKQAKPDFYDNGMYAMAILSDVQEVLARTSSWADRNHGDSHMMAELETARQWINKAKYFIDEGRPK